MPTYINLLILNLSQFFVEICTNIVVNKDLFTPVCFSLVQYIAIMTEVTTSDIGIDLVSKSLQCAGIQNRPSTAW
jgi:hypothetical protein